MAIRTVNLYDYATSTTFGTIYFNSNTAAWYSDSSCQNQISNVNPPVKSQYTFTGYRIANSSTAVLYIDADGNIVYSPSWTSTGTTTLYARWTQLSKRYTIDPNYSDLTTITWTPRTTEFFRTVEASTHFYSDDQLKDEITSIQLPYESGKSCAGLFTTNSDTGVRTYYVNADGTLNTSSGISTSTLTTDFHLASSVRMWTCYNMTLNANGGTGGPTDPVWWDRVRDKWCADDIMSEQITSITSLPTRSGYIFKGYYTASSGGTQVIAADGTLGTYSALASSNKTVYAQWESPVTITADHGSGTGTFTNLYYGGGQFFDSSELTNAITSVNVPTLTNYKFLGYYSAASSGTQYIDASGNILAAFAPSSACTIYAQYERVSYTVNVEANGGGGVSVLYANAAKTALYADEMCSGTALTYITPLTRAGYRFLGIYDADSVSGTLLVDCDGTFTSAMETFLAGLTGSATVYAIWKQVTTITVDQQGGTGSPGEIYYEDAYGRFYDSSAMTTPVTSIAVPERECYAFGGYYTGTEGSGTQRVAADGSIVSGYAPTEAETIYATWTRRSYKYEFDANGGTVGTAAIYCDGSSAAFYADDALTQEVGSIAVPTYPGYTFTGYADGSTTVVGEDGAIALTSAFAADATAAAGWTANAYTLTFDYNGGSGSTASKTVTFGQAIGELPTATRSHAYFKGWVVNGEAVTSSSVFSVPSNTVAVASWDLQFGGVTDWFGLGLGLGGSSLVAISSSSGDNKQRLCVAHYGKYESGVNAIGGVWRNPTVTYQVVRDATFRVTLGKAYAGSSGISGFMITSAEVQTRIGAFPTVTVRAAANEGSNAINTFVFSISIKGRARAQNLMNAISGGGQLQSCSLSATCDPVVVAEDNMPCASDVVNGRLTVGATLYAPNGESAPTAVNGFTSIGEPKECGDKNYTAWNITAQKEI